MRKTLQLRRPLALAALCLAGAGVLGCEKINDSWSGMKQDTDAFAKRQTNRVDQTTDDVVNTPRDELDAQLSKADQKADETQIVIEGKMEEQIDKVTPGSSDTAGDN